MYYLLDKVSTGNELLTPTQLLRRIMYVIQTLLDFSNNAEEHFLELIFTTKYVMSGFSITTSITIMIYFINVVSRSRYMNNISKLVTTPTTNNDLI